MTTPSLPDTALRDALAVDRTELANERTLLSYLRTGMSSAAAGVAVANLYEERGALVVAACLVLLGVLAVVVGIGRFLRVRRRLAAADPRKAAR